MRRTAKITALIIIAAINAWGIQALFSRMGKTDAYFRDEERMEDNRYTGGKMDLMVFAGGGFEFKLNDNDEKMRVVIVRSKGNVPILYKAEADNFVGDIDLCNALGLSVMAPPETLFDGNLPSFSITDRPLDTPSVETLIVKTSLDGSDPSLGNKTCEFDFVFRGYQDGVTTGFTDTERVHAVVSTEEFGDGGDDDCFPWNMLDSPPPWAHCHHSPASPFSGADEADNTAISRDTLAVEQKDTQGFKDIKNPAKDDGTDGAAPIIGTQGNEEVSDSEEGADTEGAQTPDKEGNTAGAEADASVESDSNAGTEDQPTNEGSDQQYTGEDRGGGDKGDNSWLKVFDISNELGRKQSRAVRNIQSQFTQNSSFGLPQSPDQGNEERSASSDEDGEGGEGEIE